MKLKVEKTKTNYKLRSKIRITNYTTNFFLQHMEQSLIVMTTIEIQKK